MTNLSHGVVRASVRPETVRARLKVGLEDRLQHQLQGRLHDTVRHRRDAQPAGVRRPGFGIIRSLTGSGLNVPVRNADRTSAKNATRAALGLDVVAAGRRMPAAVRPCSPHPRPRLPEEGRVGHEVEQITKPAIGIGLRPQVQLGLDPQYPIPLRPDHRDRPRRRPIFTRASSDIPSLLIADCYWPPSPCVRLSRTPSTTRLRPTQANGQSTDGPTSTWLVEVRAAPDGSRVHCAPIDEGGARLLPRRHRHDYAADLHRGLRPRRYRPDPESTAQQPGGRALQAGPDPPDSEPVHRLRGVLAGSSRTPSRLARRTRTIWQYWHDPTLSGLLPPSPAPPEIRLPPASPGRCDGPATKVSHLHSVTQAPRGARSRR